MLLSTSGHSACKLQLSASRERGESPGPRGSLRISPFSGLTVVSIAWVASLVAFVALWTLAPSVIFLQSMQQHPAAGVSPSADATFVTLSAQVALQHSRRMRGQGLPAELQRGEPEAAAAAAAAAVPGNVPDCQKVQQAQLPSSKHRNATGSGLVSTPPQPVVHAAAQRSKPQQPQPHQQQHSMQHPKQQQQQGQSTAQAVAMNAQHGLPADLVKQLGPVDIVYMWVNGSDPILAEELQQFEARQRQQGVSARSVPLTKGDAVRQSRFDSGRDELRYSLRSLEMYMPWFNRLYIITNGQVPTWLNHHLSRVTIVPHTSIFKNHTHLPTFNSNAIATNLANIPGLSETFILLDDDVFLTAPWTLADFVGPDGGQVLTGSGLVSMIKPMHRLYFEMLTHTNDLFDKTFGPHPRYDPAHSPRLMQKKYLQELQQKLPDAFEQTSASPARLPTDIMIGAGAYIWYVSQFQPGKHPIAPDSRTTFSTLNDMTSREYWNAAIADFRSLLAAQDPHATAYNQQHAKEWFNRVALDYKLQSGHDGPMCAKTAQHHLHVLIQTWSRPGAKNVVMNDDLTDSFASARLLMNTVIRGFLEARYSRRSSFELPLDGINGCKGRLPKTEFGQLPTSADYKLICKPPPPPASAKSAHSPKQVPARSIAATPTHVAGTALRAAAHSAPVAPSASSGAATPRIEQKAVPTLAALIKTPGQVGLPHIAVA